MTEEYLIKNEPIELFLVELEYPFDGRRIATFKTKDIKLCKFLGRNHNTQIDRINVFSKENVLNNYLEKAKVLEAIERLDNCQCGHRDCSYCVEGFIRRKLLKELGFVAGETPTGGSK